MAAPHLSAWTRIGSTVYLSGQLAFDAGGRIQGDDAGAQTTRTLENIQATLATLDLSPNDIVKATVWLRERSDFPAFNDAYAVFFAEHRPTRSTVFSELVLPQARVEIEVIAHDKRAS